MVTVELFFQVSLRAEGSCCLQEHSEDFTPWLEKPLQEEADKRQNGFMGNKLNEDSVSVLLFGA